MSVLDRAKSLAPDVSSINKTEALTVLALLGAAAFLRFWRLGTPDTYFFDEVYHAFTGREFLHGNPLAWEFSASPPQGFAYEWTHPPLAKLFMAGGMLFFGENPFGWRFFSALFGTLSVLMVYLIGKRLFRNEEIAFIAAFLSLFEGLWFVQSRIAMNDAYVVFFILCTIYCMLTERHLLAGIFFGAALASKWSAVWLVFPMATYLVYRFVQTDAKKRRAFTMDALLNVPYFYIAIPLFIYLLSYLPFFLTGHDFRDFWETQKQMYWYHSRLVATHPYQSPWDTWPIDQRPVYYYLSPSGDAKIYNLGNPLIYWFGLPALAFALWQGVRRLRVRFHSDTGDIAFTGKLTTTEFGLLFVVICYLSFWAPWALSPRIMFSYHYLPALPFLILALGYGIWRLWQAEWGKPAALALTTAIVLTFVYFYPHWAAVAVPGWLEESYYWFPSWR